MPSSFPRPVPTRATRPSPASRTSAFLATFSFPYDARPTAPGHSSSQGLESGFSQDLTYRGTQGTEVTVDDASNPPARMSRKDRKKKLAQEEYGVKCSYTNLVSRVDGHKEEVISMFKSMNVARQKNLIAYCLDKIKKGEELDGSDGCVDAIKVLTCVMKALTDGQVRRGEGREGKGREQEGGRRNDGRLRRPSEKCERPQVLKKERQDRRRTTKQEKRTPKSREFRPFVHTCLWAVACASSMLFVRQ